MCSYLIHPFLPQAFMFLTLKFNETKNNTGNNFNADFQTRSFLVDVHTFPACHSLVLLFLYDSTVNPFFKLNVYHFGTFC